MKQTRKNRQARCYFNSEEKWKLTFWPIFSAWIFHIPHDATPPPPTPRQGWNRARGLPWRRHYLLAVRLSPDVSRGGGWGEEKQSPRSLFPPGRRSPGKISHIPTYRNNGNKGSKEIPKSNGWCQKDFSCRKEICWFENFQLISILLFVINIIWKWIKCNKLIWFICHSLHLCEQVKI